MVEEKNSKTVTTGSFGYEERLKIFLTDKKTHGPMFDEFLLENNLVIEDLFSVQHKEIENLLTITSSRGVAKTGISLKTKNLAIYRFDDLDPSVTRFNPVTNEIEN